MAVKDGAGPRPAAQTAKRCFLNCLETSSFKPCFYYLPSRSANCQLACVVLQLAFVLHGSGQGTPSQGSNTMAVKDGAGPRPAAQTAKRCFLNCLETSFKPCFYLPSCSANCQLACVVLQLAFVLHGSGPGTPSQGSNTMAVKDGAGPRPAAQTAKRCFLNCLETSFKPCFYLPSCSANCQLACVVLQLAFVLHGSGQGTPSQGSNTMAVKDGAGPRPAAQTAKRCFLNCLETTSFKPCFYYLPSCSANCQLACVVSQLAPNVAF